MGSEYKKTLPKKKLQNSLLPLHNYVLLCIFTSHKIPTKYIKVCGWDVRKSEKAPGAWKLLQLTASVTRELWIRSNMTEVWKKERGDEISLETAINHRRASAGILDTFQTRRSQRFRLKAMTYCTAPACLKSQIFNTRPNLFSNKGFWHSFAEISGSLLLNGRCTGLFLTICQVKNTMFDYKLTKSS